MRHSRSSTRFFLLHFHLHSLFFLFLSSTKLKKSVDTFCRSSYFSTFSFFSAYSFSSSTSSITSLLFCHDFFSFSSIRSHRFYSVMILFLFIRQYEHIALIHSSSKIRVINKQDERANIESAQTSIRRAEIDEWESQEWYWSED